jgi:hypothetical protein
MVRNRRPGGQVNAVATSEEAPPLSLQRAFVVQFRAGAGATPACFMGRVEHIASTQATRFESLEDLITFLTRVLAKVQD